MPACDCQGPMGDCPCDDRGGYYSTKVVRPGGASRPRPPINATDLTTRVHAFSVPELRELMQRRDVAGRGNNSKHKMVELLTEDLLDYDEAELITEYEEEFGRGGCPCR